MFVFILRGYIIRAPYIQTISFDLWMNKINGRDTQIDIVKKKVNEQWFKIRNIVMKLKFPTIPFTYPHKKYIFPKTQKQDTWHIIFKITML